MLILGIMSVSGLVFPEISSAEGKWVATFENTVDEPFIRQLFEDLERPISLNPQAFNTLERDIQEIGGK